MTIFVLKKVIHMCFVAVARSIFRFSFRLTKRLKLSGLTRSENRLDKRNATPDSMIGQKLFVAGDILSADTGVTNKANQPRLHRERGEREGGREGEREGGREGGREGNILEII